MSRPAKTLERVLRGTSDANIAFDDLCGLLRHLGLTDFIVVQASRLLARVQQDCEASDAMARGTKQMQARRLHHNSFVRESLGFTERVKGSHHIYTRDGIAEILNLQPKGGKAKAYQVAQVRDVIVGYGLAEEPDEPPATDTASDGTPTGDGNGQ